MPKIKTRLQIKEFPLNSQTTLYISDVSLFAAYNQHSECLVLNASILSEDETEAIRGRIKGGIKKEITSDCFALTIYQDDEFKPFHEL